MFLNILIKNLIKTQNHITEILLLHTVPFLSFNPNLTEAILPKKGDALQQVQG